MYSLLHCHFESALRAIAISRPDRIESLRRVYSTPEYRRSTPAERLTLLWKTVLSLADEDIFTEAIFRRVVRRMLDEMQDSQVEHVDLRIGPSTGRWRWMTSAADGIDIFREEMSKHDGSLSMTFLAGINMTKSASQLDSIFNALTGRSELMKKIAGLDLNFLPSDIPKFDRYLHTLKGLQASGLKVNIHLGELFDNEVSRYILARITPDRIGHGVRLLDDDALVDTVRGHRICLDMCPTSNTLLGVVDWRHSNPAKTAFQLGIPVTINTDDPILFNTSIDREIRLAGLSPAENDEVAANGKRYRYDGP